MKLYNCIVHPHTTCSFNSYICSKSLEIFKKNPLTHSVPGCKKTHRLQQLHIYCSWAGQNSKCGWTLPTPFWNTISDQSWWPDALDDRTVDCPRPQITPFCWKPGPFIVRKITHIPRVHTKRKWQARMWRQAKNHDNPSRSIIVGLSVENTTWIEPVQVGTRNHYDIQVPEWILTFWIPCKHAKC